MEGEMLINSLKTEQSSPLTHLKRGMASGLVIISVSTSIVACKARGTLQNASKSKGIIGSDSGDVSTFLFNSPAETSQICALQCDFAGVAEIIDERDPSQSGNPISLKEAGCRPKAKCVDKSANAAFFNSALKQCGKTVDAIESEKIESVPQDCEDAIKKVADLVIGVGTDLDIYASRNRESIESQLNRDITSLREALIKLVPLPKPPTPVEASVSKADLERLKNEKQGLERKLSDQDDTLKTRKSHIETIVNITKIAEREERMRKIRQKEQEDEANRAKIRSVFGPINGVCLSDSQTSAFWKKSFHLSERSDGVYIIVKGDCDSYEQWTLKCEVRPKWSENCDEISCTNSNGRGLCTKLFTIDLPDTPYTGRRGLNLGVYFDSGSYKGWYKYRVNNR